MQIRSHSDHYTSLSCLVTDILLSARVGTGGPYILEATSEIVQDVHVIFCWLLCKERILHFRCVIVDRCNAKIMVSIVYLCPFLNRWHAFALSACFVIFFATSGYPSEVDNRIMIIDF